MSVRPVPLLAVLALVGAAACASTPVRPEAEAPPREYTFVKRPAKPRGCAFEVFEQREPPRPYTVLGSVPLASNWWLGAGGRKAALSDTACRSGADAVLLPHPTERKLGSGDVLREYSAVFVSYSDGPAKPDADEAPAPRVPPPDEDTVVIPVGEELLGDTDGTLTRPVGPEDDAYWE